jgi:S1-C subfamily serine protease
MQSLTSADNIGYLVPTPVIQHFLDDIKDGRYDGFPDDGLYIQSMENESLKQHYKMKNRSGVLITNIVPGSSCDGYLKKNDVLLAIDGISVADDATILMEGNGRVAANYLIRTHHINETFEATVLRDAKELKINVPLKGLVSLVPYEHDQRPRYYIFGGVVLMPLSKNYLFEWGRNWLQKAPIHFVNAIKNDNMPSTERQEIVFIQSVLADKENTGYDFAHADVIKVNGVKVNSFATLVNTIETTKDKEIRLTLKGGSLIIINKEKALQANERLLKRYSIKDSAYLRE